MKGRWPKLDIDHKNRKRSDNRWNNLRLATNNENGYNRSLSCHNTSGYNQVHYRKDRNKYRVNIVFEGTTIYVGLYDTKEEGARAYQRMSRKLHQQYSAVN